MAEDAGKTIVHVSRDGYQITAGITHQIRVQGDNTWVKYEVVGHQLEGESDQEAARRVISVANNGVMMAVEQVVETVETYSNY